MKLGAMMVQRSILTAYTAWLNRNGYLNNPVNPVEKYLKEKWKNKEVKDERG